ncbi:hypothetical protein R1sor_019676 [Riccia sorocarpa]|uniref:Uncharacterized protein n=1 Tax=Riccia sorocarpa TaxID=122646 RepID=A0ABD3IGI0_9MARC
MWFLDGLPEGMEMYCRRMGSNTLDEAFKSAETYEVAGLHRRNRKSSMRFVRTPKPEAQVNYIAFEDPNEDTLRNEEGGWPSDIDDVLRVETRSKSKKDDKKSDKRKAKEKKHEEKKKRKDASSEVPRKTAEPMKEKEKDKEENPPIAEPVDTPPPSFPADIRKEVEDFLQEEIAKEAQKQVLQEGAEPLKTKPSEVKILKPEEVPRKDFLTSPYNDIFKDVIQRKADITFKQLFDTNKIFKKEFTLH